MNWLLIFLFPFIILIMLIEDIFHWIKGDTKVWENSERSIAAYLVDIFSE